MEGLEVVGGVPQHTAHEYAAWQDRYLAFAATCDLFHLPLPAPMHAHDRVHLPTHARAVQSLFWERMVALSEPFARWLLPMVRT